MKNDLFVLVIIGLFGGENNIEDVDVCMICLCVMVKDIYVVVGESEWK